jgi:hypothetical protein
VTLIWLYNSSESPVYEARERYIGYHHFEYLPCNHFLVFRFVPFRDEWTTKVYLSHPDRPRYLLSISDRLLLRSSLISSTVSTPKPETRDDCPARGEPETPFPRLESCISRGCEIDATIFCLGNSLFTSRPFEPPLSSISPKSPSLLFPKLTRRFKK